MKLFLGIILSIFLISGILYAEDPVAFFDAEGKNSNIYAVSEGDGQTILTEVNGSKGVAIDPKSKGSLYIYFKIDESVRNKINPDAYMVITAYSDNVVYSVPIRCNLAGGDAYGFGGYPVMEGKKWSKSYAHLSDFKPSGAMNYGTDFRFDAVNDIFISRVEIYNKLPEGLENAVSSNAVMKYISPDAKWQGSGVDPRTIVNKVMCGYQGWFGTPGDEGGYKNFGHYTGKKGTFAPGSCSIDLWPDTGEYEKVYETDFVNPDGTKAVVFSSQDASTADLHFKWMKEYGIDGVYIQRFVVGLRDGAYIYRYNNVLYNSRVAANKYGRAFAVTYDLSGMTSGDVETIIKDWKLLVDEAKITKDPAYLHHKNKPVIEIWGVGFNDNRAYNLADCKKLVDFFKDDPKYGNCYVVVGVPNGWRELNADCLNDPLMTEIMLKSDCISPWAPGRYHDVESFNKLLETRYAEDMKWCDKNKKLYMPVVFPGFSWYNMFPDTPVNMIPRLKGDFLWAQYTGYAKKGVKAVYQAMFDEIDEGTAIFKCTNTPPDGGGSLFATYEGLPSDYYLKMVGEGKKLITGERKDYNKDLPEISESEKEEIVTVSVPMTFSEKSKELKKLIGVKTVGSLWGYNDVKITALSNHVIERALERNVSYKDLMDALLNPIEVEPYTYDNSGRPGQKYIGTAATVVLNPQTGVLITTYRTE